MKDICLLYTEITIQSGKKIKWLYEPFSYVGEPRETSQPKQGMMKASSSLYVPCDNIPVLANSNSIGIFGRQWLANLTSSSPTLAYLLFLSLDAADIKMTVNIKPPSSSLSLKGWIVSCFRRNGTVSSSSGALVLCCWGRYQLETNCTQKEQVTPSQSQDPIHATHNPPHGACTGIY